MSKFCLRVTIDKVLNIDTKSSELNTGTYEIDIQLETEIGQVKSEKLQIVLNIKGEEEESSSEIEEDVNSLEGNEFFDLLAQRLNEDSQKQDEDLIQIDLSIEMFDDGILSVTSSTPMVWKDLSSLLPQSRLLSSSD